MTKELLLRFLTSLVLLLVLFYAMVFSGIYLMLLLILFYFLAAYEIIKNTNNILFIFFANILLLLSFYSFYYLRGNSDYSLIILFWILITTFLSDTGGFLFGKFFGGKKLTKLSPNKTYSGSVGSFILSCSSLPLLNFLQTLWLSNLIVDFLELNFLAFTVGISLICQLGDLSVSFCKRKINIKNTSNMLPGHGWVLDRIDGLIFVLIFSLLLKLFELI